MKKFKNFSTLHSGIHINFMQLQATEIVPIFISPNVNKITSKILCILQNKPLSLSHTTLSRYIINIIIA